MSKNYLLENNNDKLRIKTWGRTPTPDPTEDVKSAR